MVFLLLGKSAIIINQRQNHQEGNPTLKYSSKEAGQFFMKEGRPIYAKRERIFLYDQGSSTSSRESCLKNYPVRQYQNCMDSRLEQLLQRQLCKPRKFAKLKQDPFPYLAQSNRQEIFEFIVQIEAQNSNLTVQLAEKYPHRTLQQCFEQHRALQVKRSLIQINLDSIQKMDIEIAEKMQQTQRMRARNLQLQRISEELAQSFELIESDLIEVQKEKRFLEMKLKLQQERDSKAVDLSLILQNLYHEVKDTLNQPL